MLLGYIQSTPSSFMEQIGVKTPAIQLLTMPLRCRGDYFDDSKETHGNITVHSD